MFKPFLNKEDNEVNLISEQASNLNDDYESEDDDYNDDAVKFKRPNDVQDDFDYLLDSQNKLKEQIDKNGRSDDLDDIETFAENSSQNIEYSDEDDDDVNDQFVIEIGSSKIPIISCSNNKLNLAVRSALAQHVMICSDLRKLNSFISTIRNSYNLDRLFQNSKCRLRLENNTRWGSAYLSLETVIRAILKNAIQKENLPVPLSRIETYYLVLQPTYNLNISFQSNNCTIADVVPFVLSYIEAYEEMEKTGRSLYAKSWCSLLAKNIKGRFEFELNSEVYKVKYQLE